jgi:hypothetical protein
MYSEQYMLAAMLVSPRPLFEILLPNHFVCLDSEMGIQVCSILEPFGQVAYGGSFWVKKV